MPRRPRLVSMILLSAILLVGCNLPLNKQVHPVPATETQAPAILPATWTPVVPSKAPDTQVPPTQEATRTPITRMLAPSNVKTGILAAGEYQKFAPDGFRKLLVYPIGGMEVETNDCDISAVAPSFFHAPDQIQALTVDISENRFVSCGWHMNETVSITLIRPDGSQERTFQLYDGNMDMSYFLPMEYGMQLGDYSLTLESPSGKITHDFKVIWPASPGLVKTEEKKFFVYGFQPGEHAYIMAYQKSGDALRLSTWRGLSMDGRGELMVEDRFTADLLAVVGDTSGPVWNNWLLGMFIGKNLYYAQVELCNGAPTSRLQPFSFAYVTKGAPNNVRSSPSKSAPLVGLIKANAVIIVQMDAPVCADGLLWWKIVLRDEVGPSGWTAEGQASDYWLAPLE
jgi:hypothetical protein